jgi:dTDP-glucose 4,6-dehydratase
MTIHNTTAGWKRIIRIFNTYGPRMRLDDGRVLPHSSQALRGENLTVFGDGSQTRSFCYVDDLVEAHLSPAAQRLLHAVNISSDEITIRRFGEEIARYSPASSSKYVPGTARNDNGMARTRPGKF